MDEALPKMKFQSREGLRGIQNYNQGLDGMDLDQKSHAISAFFMFEDMLDLCSACLRIFFVPLMLDYNLRKGQIREGLRGIQNYTQGLYGMDLDQNIT